MIRPWVPWDLGPQDLKTSAIYSILNLEMRLAGSAVNGTYGAIWPHLKQQDAEHAAFPTPAAPWWPLRPPIPSISRCVGSPTRPDEPRHVAVRDPHAADEGEADEVAQVPRPLMFESFHQCLLPGRHVEFQDERDR